MAINSLPMTEVAGLIQELRAVHAPLTRQQYNALAEKLGWHTVSESAKSLVVETASTAGGRIHVQLDGDMIRNIAISISTSTDRSPEAAEATTDLYQQATATASEALGTAADGQHGGDKPHTWWSLPHAAIDLSRWGYAVVLTWATPTDHAGMLESIGAKQ